MKNPARAAEPTYNKTKAKDNFIPPEPTSGLKKGNTNDIKDDPKKRTPAASQKPGKHNQYDSLDDGTKATKRGYAEKAEGGYEDAKGKQSKASVKTESIRRK
jgi:hypothetical protein